MSTQPSHPAQGKKPYQAGFTLVELSVSLSIIALIITSFLNIYGRSLSAEKTIETQEKIKVIAEALQQFVDQNDYLPCPANFTNAYDDQYFLNEPAGDAGTGDCSDVAAGFQVAGTNIVMGAVPTGELRLHPSYAVDGWGRYFSFVVDEDLTSSANFTTTTTGYTKGDIQIQDAGGNSLIPTGPDGAENAAYLLISHGANLHGSATPGTGTRISVGSAASRTLEDDNAHMDTALDAIFRIEPERLLEGADPTAAMTDQIFNDIMIYRTKWQLKN